MPCGSAVTKLANRASLTHSVHVALEGRTAHTVALVVSPQQAWVSCVCDETHVSTIVILSNVTQLTLHMSRDEVVPWWTMRAYSVYK